MPWLSHSALVKTFLLSLLAFSIGAPADNFSYMTSLNAAEAAAGPLDIFHKLDTLSQTDAEALSNRQGSALQRLLTMRALAGDSTGAAEVYNWWHLLSKVEPSIARKSQRTMELGTAQ